jgi:hypothetical protein
MWAVIFLLISVIVIVVLLCLVHEEKDSVVVVFGLVGIFLVVFSGSMALKGGNTDKNEDQCSSPTPTFAPIPTGYYYVTPTPTMTPRGNIIIDNHDGGIINIYNGEL